MSGATRTPRLVGSTSQIAKPLPAASGTVNLDLSQGWAWYGVITGNVTFNLINVPASGTLAEVQIKVTQDATGGRSVAGWKVNGTTVVPSWDTGVAPVVDPTPNASTVLNVQTYNGGATLDGHGASAATPKGTFRPSDYGLVGWSSDPAVGAGAAQAPISNRMLTNEIILPDGGSVTNVCYIGGVAGATPTAGKNWAGIYDTAGNLLGQSADASAFVTSTGLVAIPLAAPLGPFPAGTKLVAALILTATTVPQIGRIGSLIVSAISSGAFKQRQTQSVASVDTLPASFVRSGQGQPGVIFWMGAS